MKSLNQAQFEKKQVRQIRAIKRYARANNIDIETACKRWVLNGLAKRWADKYEELK